MTIVNRVVVLTMLILIGAAGCRGGDPGDGDIAPVVTFERGEICIITATDTIPMAVEFAENDEQRAHGLMERDHLPPDAGMLFTYDDVRPADEGFWMYRTRIPLDIAFVDSTGVIGSIRPMEPCQSPDPRWCESYAAGVRFAAALEANRGYFAQRGIAVGDRVLRAGEPGCAR